MALPNESSIYCSRCSAYNIGDDCCICKSCMNKIIDKLLEGDKIILDKYPSKKGELKMRGANLFAKQLKQELTLIN